MDDSEDEVFMGRIGDKEKKLLLNEFRKFGNVDVKHDTDVTCDTIVQVVNFHKDVVEHIGNNNETVKYEVKDSEVQLADFPKDNGIIRNNSVTVEDEMRDSSSEVIVFDLSTSTEELDAGLAGPSPTNAEDKTLNRNFGNTHLVQKSAADKFKCLQDHNCKFENSFGNGMTRWNVSESDHSETNLNSTLENVENLLAQGIKFMLTDDNGVDISHFLPAGCDILDFNKEKPLNEDFKMKCLASSNHSIEYKKQKFELPNTDIFKCHVEDSFTSTSETNLNDTLENVENLLSHGIKYMLTDDNGIDVSHLLPDGCGIYDKKASQNEDPKFPNSVNGKDTFIIPDIECGNTKSEGPIVRLQNKCGSVVREYIDVNPPQFISNVKPKHLTKIGNRVKAKQTGVMKRRIVSSEGRQHYRTRKPVASSVKLNINSPLPAVDYTSTVGLMLKNIATSPRTGSAPVITKHIGRIRLPSQFQSKTSYNNEEVSLLLSTPVARSKRLKPKQIWK